MFTSYFRNTVNWQVGGARAKNRVKTYTFIKIMFYFCLICCIKVKLNLKVVD